MKTIPVSFSPFDSYEDITCQAGTIEDGEFYPYYCNHAGAVEEDVEFTIDSWWEDAQMSVPDDSEIRRVMVCDKENCGEVV